MPEVFSDTIIALATPPGRGGVGVVRISGDLVNSICQHIVGELIPPRYAKYTEFYAKNGEILDQGLVLRFAAPHSFTGEDVLELQGHGGPVVMDSLIKRGLELGARMARPGEFSERAFLNNKLDLLQAEAVADLIAASSEQAAKSALRSLQGEFSNGINSLLAALINLRVYVEAAIDFPTEEIDFLTEGKVQQQLFALQTELKLITQQATQGALLHEGVNAVLIGAPNAGKSSLLNRLTGSDTAIVTEVAGTTRDLLRCTITIDGLPLNIIDTAGLRDTQDKVELEGIKRARHALQKADLLLLICDLRDEIVLPIDEKPPLGTIVIYNKIDLLDRAPAVVAGNEVAVYLSAKTGDGVDLLRQQIKKSCGFNAEAGAFSARRRHLQALAQVEQHLTQAQATLIHSQAGELVAEELRLAQQALAEITGKFSSDDLLGEIFSSFCIGK
jgi:tRNA modification GTPase